MSEGHANVYDNKEIKMKKIDISLNLLEHCPDCGALLLNIPGGALCPHCGFECEQPEERQSFSLSNLPGRRGEGVRFVLLDLYPSDAIDEAA